MLLRLSQRLIETEGWMKQVIGQANYFLKRMVILKTSDIKLILKTDQLFLDDQLANLTARVYNLAKIHEKLENLLMKNKKPILVTEDSGLPKTIRVIRNTLMEIDSLYRYASIFYKKLMPAYNKDKNLTERLNLFNFLFTSELHKNIGEAVGMVKMFLSLNNATYPVLASQTFHYKGVQFLSKVDMSDITISWM